MPIFPTLQYEDIIALLAAVQSSNAEAVHRILQAGVHRDVPSAHGPADFALESYQTDLLALLLRYNFPPSPDLIELWTERPTHTIGLSRKLLATPTARDRAQPSVVLLTQQMLRDFQARGPEAFEEAPGSVVLQDGPDLDPDALEYVDRWTRQPLAYPPVSCRWYRQRDPRDGTPFYLNTITGQVKLTRPNALAWVVRKTEDGATYWYNYATGTTERQMTPRPAELSPGLASEARARAGLRYVNVVSGVETDADYREQSWRAVQAPDGTVWWLKAGTRERSAIKPKEAEDALTWRDRAAVFPPLPIPASPEL